MYRNTLIVILSLGIVYSAFAASQKHREIQRGNETKLQVSMEISYGTVTIEQGGSDAIAVLDYDENDDTQHKLQISYDVSGGCGYLHIKSKKSSHIWEDEDSEKEKNNKHHLFIKLSNAIPVDLDLSLGAGRSDINLTDIQINELKISTGASSVSLQCNKPNRLSAQDVSIETGVSKFTATGLCNLNFHNFKFSGGIGSYRLDFGGTLVRNAKAKIEVGLGSITINVPKYIPAKLYYDDNWLSSFRVDDDFEKIHSGEYQTQGFLNASSRLTFDLEAGLGSIKVRRSP